MWQKRFQQILLIVSIGSFVGSTAYGTASMFSTALNPTPKANSQANAKAKSPETQLQSRERGYEIVLQREPENQVALQGLVELKIQRNDLAGAIAPMEKLAKLHPNRPDYQALLAQLKQQTAQGEKKANQDKSSEQPKTK